MLWQKADAGRVTLAYLDESEVSPALPVCRSWALQGKRVFIPHESNQQQRVNVIAAMIANGETPLLTWMLVPRTFRTVDALHLIENWIPREPGGLVIVLDNAGIHGSRMVQTAIRRLRRQENERFYLPPRAPELNAVEGLIGAIKHHDLPERTYLQLDRLTTAVDGAFVRVECRLKILCA